MQARAPLAAALIAVWSAFSAVPTAQGPDREWLRAWERVQQARPGTVTSQARIAPPGEPGSPLVIHGRVLQADGKTPVASAIVFAYHTDREGLYDRREAGPHSWRLRGWARADADGRFVFTTIKPAEYPVPDAPPAHVHFTIVTSDGARYHGRDLHPDQVPSRREKEADAVDHVLTIDPARRF